MLLNIINWRSDVHSKVTPSKKEDFIDVNVLFKFYE